jgi:hypothetical protein
MPIAGERSKKGGVLAALRRSPLVGADLDLARWREEDRDENVTVDDEANSAGTQFTVAVTPKAKE